MEGDVEWRRACISPEWSLLDIGPIANAEAGVSIGTIRIPRGNGQVNPHYRVRPPRVRR